MMNKERVITIKDIAKKAGVSISAVSLALNDKPGVSKETKQKILTICSSLGYSGKSEKKSSYSKKIVKVLKILRHGKTINNNHSVFIDTYIDGINSGAKEVGIHLEIGTYDQHVLLSTLNEHILEDTHVFGYLVIATELSDRDILDLLSTNKPMVFIDTLKKSILADFVVMNNFDGIHTIISDLVAKGHKEIGMVTSSVPTENFHDREEAFHSVMKMVNLEIKSQFIIDVDSTFTGAYEGMTSFLMNHPPLPTAFLAVNDIVALGCMKALQENGYHIPDDVSIIAFDNLPMASMSNPPLTTIDVSKHEMGKQALRLLLQKVDAVKPLPPMKLLVGGFLVERESVKTLL